MCLQEYRARKRQRLKKKLTEQLKSSLRQGSASASAALGAASDLQTILNSFTGERERERESNEGYVTVCLFLHLPDKLSAGVQGTGSRFQHAEKLQFAKVCTFTPPRHTSLVSLAYVGILSAWTLVEILILLYRRQLISLYSGSLVI